MLSAIAGGSFQLSNCSANTIDEAAMIDVAVCAKVTFVPIVAGLADGDEC
jgi:hypothetical protein